MAMIRCWSNRSRRGCLRDEASGRHRKKSSSAVGAQHALFLLATLLVDRTTVVGMENPGYPDARNIFATRAGELIALPLDGSGLALSKRLPSPMPR